MASQHNRSSTYKALIGGNEVAVMSREDELHKRVFGDAPREKKPHGLPSEEELNKELQTMKVNPRSYSSIAGASSTSFDDYRMERRKEHERLEKMYKDAETELKEEQFAKTKRAREDAEAEKTSQRAAKRHKKKDAQKKRQDAFKKLEAAGKAPPVEGLPGPGPHVGPAPGPAPEAAPEVGPAPGPAPEAAPEVGPAPGPAPAPST
eukprot:TRINITY_DN18329_c0_g2_i1.p1 TRINITY_DN18329_c0_g2~~TRINITY_DN18329_c0_g2_i1.p1  ORF type:complete len:229 (+),score=67.31 TRINITY_DN18329_c0_g2_i1:71-688(+)